MRYRWTTATRPNLPTAGMSGFNTDFKTIEWWDGTSWQQDPWRYDSLASVFSTTAATQQDTGLEFTPAASRTYIIEAYLMVRTTSANVAAQVGVKWPTAGVDDAAGSLTMPANGKDAAAVHFWGGATDESIGHSDMPDATNSWFAGGRWVLVMGASPTGAFRITLQSETNGTSVSMRAGSVLRWKEIF